MGDLTKAVRALVDPRAPSWTLPQMKPADPIPSKVGRGIQKGEAVAASGGIASPLTENGYLTREYWSNHYQRTTDGLFLLEIAPVKTLHFTDAGGAAVDFIFSQPE